MFNVRVMVNGSRRKYCYFIDLINFFLIKLDLSRFDRLLAINFVDTNKAFRIVTEKIVKKTAVAMYDTHMKVSKQFEVKPRGVSI